MMDIFTWK